MFVVARAFIGAGATLSMVAAAAYAAETLPVKYRGWGVGLLGDLYYVGMCPLGNTMVRSRTEQTRRTHKLRRYIRHGKNAVYVGLEASICSSRLV